MSEDVPEYDLWLEFELWVDDDLNLGEDFFNMQLELPDGRQYAFTVWTYGVFASLVDDAKKDGENLHGLYLHPPDLFVRRMDRPTCERAIEHMIATNTLPEHCRCHEADDWDD